jgi:DNA-binding phage protein
MSSEWCEAIRASQLSTIPDRLTPQEKVERQPYAESAAFIHLADLLALIARLKRERIRRGLSLGDVARATNQNRSALSRLENGHYPNPTFNTVYRYARALQMRIAMKVHRCPSPSKSDGDQP